jgi:hypothetical protein
MLHATQIRVIDGDTIVADVALPFAATLRRQHIRFLGVNAWEIHGPERPRGLVARAFVVGAIAEGDVYLEPHAEGKRDIPSQSSFRQPIKKGVVPEFRLMVPCTARHFSQT